MVSVSEAELVVPSAGLPPAILPMRSNNNLDVGVVGDTTFLAWRTAPLHFASGRARLEVVSSTNSGSWKHEHTIAMNRDVREPRFAVLGDRLLMYFFPAGTHPAKFEPEEIHVTERTGPGEWTDPKPVSPKDHVVWRVRPIRGRLVMSLYADASGAYTADRFPKAMFWTSTDGYEWETLFESDAFEDGTTETDFVTLPDGNFLLSSRKESRGGGLGTLLSVIDPTGKVIESRHDARKFDSPALFNWKGETFIVTRRQRAFGGRLDVVPGFVPDAYRDIGNQIGYWVTPKATALYRIDRSTLEAEFIRDLPGCGDTAFASIVGDEDDNTVTVYNYSSPLWMKHAPWVAGQLLPTQIHRTSLTRD